MNESNVQNYQCSSFCDQSVILSHMCQPNDMRLHKHTQNTFITSRKEKSVPEKTKFNDKRMLKPRKEKRNGERISQSLNEAIQTYLNFEIMYKNARFAFRCNMHVFQYQLKIVV